MVWGSWSCRIRRLVLWGLTLGASPWGLFSVGVFGGFHEARAFTQTSVRAPASENYSETYPKCDFQTSVDYLNFETYLTSLISAQQAHLMGTETLVAEYKNLCQQSLAQYLNTKCYDRINGQIQLVNFERFTESCRQSLKK